jgi:hypothetical protein
VCRIVENFDASSKQLVDLTNKSNDDMAELETTTTYLIEKMKDEGDGDDNIWMSKKDQNASKPLIKSKYFHVDV